jgi:hypothetical protein
MNRRNFFLSFLGFFGVTPAARTHPAAEPEIVKVYVCVDGEPVERHVLMDEFPFSEKTRVHGHAYDPAASLPCPNGNGDDVIGKLNGHASRL